MKRPSLKNRSEESEPSDDDQITNAIIDDLSTNDKIIEIRPAKQSKSMGMKGVLLLGAGATGLAYWVQNSQKPNDLLEDVQEKAADRFHQTAEGIEEGSEAASERIEAGSERAGDAVQEAGEAVQEAGDKAADRTEEAGDKAADRTEEAGDKAAGESTTSSSSGT